MGKQVITETTIRAALARGLKTLEVPRDAIVTTLASEIAETNGVQIVVQSEAVSPPKKVPSPTENAANLAKGQVVAVGSDHGGFQLKATLKESIEGWGYKVLDVGTANEEPCDYPDYAYAVARAVSSGDAWRGVMIDGAGIGSCVVANKVPGIRAACCHNEFVARNAREHNDTNVLTLGSRVTGVEVCKEIVRIWLETWFAGGRHAGRVAKIRDVEGKFLK